MSKKWMSLFLGIVLILAAGCGGDKKADSTTTGSGAKKVLTVGTSPDFSPFEFIDDKGQMAGFDIDLIHAIGKQMNAEIKMQNLSWDGLIPALQAGNIDVVIAGIAITPERQQVALFSKPYYNTGLAILVKKGGPAIASEQDLKGKRIAVQIGTVGAERAHKIEGATVSEFNVSADTFLALKNNNVDAVINHLPVMKYYLKTTGEKNFEVAGPMLNSMPDGIAVKKDNQALMDQINKALDELKANGEYDKIYEKWFGEKPPK